MKQSPSCQYFNSFREFFYFQVSRVTPSKVLGEGSITSALEVVEFLTRLSRFYWDFLLCGFYSR